MPFSAKKIAAAVVSIAHEKNIVVSNLKLQKLLYYTEAWGLALDRKSIFPDSIEAWVHGPVVANVFGDYKDCRWSPIAQAKADPTVDVATRCHIERVLEAYGDLSAVDLERLTHAEEPWIVARKGLAPTEPSRNEISRDIMKQFYSARLA